jgi:hypothetical protein
MEIEVHLMGGTWLWVVGILVLVVGWLLSKEGTRQAGHAAVPKTDPTEGGLDYDSTEDKSMLNDFVQIIDTRRYSTAASRRIASDRSGLVRPSIIAGMAKSWRHLYRTRKGNYFLHDIEGITPLSKDQALLLYKAFPEKAVKFEEAFTIEDA